MLRRPFSVVHEYVDDPDPDYYAGIWRLVDDAGQEVCQYPWRFLRKITLGDMYAERQRAWALVALAQEAVFQRGLLSREEAEELVLGQGLGWCCPEHPLIPLDFGDFCVVCSHEREEVLS